MTPSAWILAALLLGTLTGAASCVGVAPVGGEGEGEGEGESEATYALMVQPPPDMLLEPAADSAAVLRLSDGRLLVATQVVSGTQVITPAEGAAPVEVAAGYDISYVRVDPRTGAAESEVVNEGDIDDTIVASDQSADGTAWLAIAAGRRTIGSGTPSISPTLFLRRFSADGSLRTSVSFPADVGMSGAALAALADGGVLVHAGTGVAGITPEASSAVVARLDASGALLWAAGLDGTLEVGGAVETDTGTLAIAGAQFSALTLHDTEGIAVPLPCAHATGAYLAILTAEGAAWRTVPIDTDAIAGPPHLAVGSAGIVAAGYISGTVTLPGGTTIEPQGRQIAWAASFGNDLIEWWTMTSTEGIGNITQVRASGTDVWLVGTIESPLEFGGLRVPGGNASTWSARLAYDGTVLGVSYLDSASQTWPLTASRLDADGHGYVAAVSGGDLETPRGPIAIPSPSLVVVDDGALTAALPL
ncbi:MAG: hypothetical protein IT382_06815 [Deltaproteobacteria bacterium]|nr:hypothetical protein [Deltaproteobacteria bacterium]